MNKIQRDFITGQILDSCIEVHKQIGPGLPQNIYEKCLVKEFESRSIKVETGRELPVIYKEEKINSCFTIDLLVEDEFIVQIKSTANINGSSQSQLLTFLKHAEKRVGFLVNFNENKLIDGFNRLTYRKYR